MGKIEFGINKNAETQTTIADIVVVWGKKKQGLWCMHNVLVCCFGKLFINCICCLFLFCSRILFSFNFAELFLFFIQRQQHSCLFFVFGKAVFARLPFIRHWNTDAQEQQRICNRAGSKIPSVRSDTDV